VLAAYTFVNRREFRRWNTEDVKHCDQSISHGQASGANGFVATRAGHDPLMAVQHATAALKEAKKFHVFHQGHFWKAADLEEGSPSTKYAVVATAHSQQNPGVMRKAVGQSINRVSRQANSKVASGDLWITQDALDLIQAVPWNFSIDMHKPKDVASRRIAGSIHLHCPIGLAPNDSIAKARTEIRRAISASAVGDNNLRLRCSVPQMLEELAYECRLIKDWDND
jgi:hypothetical protein